ncbi:hypothetical protein DYD21_07295 [Rhodohalobacter sp. SW132]|nr:hypothetical protein DYD21_07295 [Rhodohalobacter sp. SW132]
MNLAGLIIYDNSRIIKFRNHYQFRKFRDVSGPIPICFQDGNILIKKRLTSPSSICKKNTIH